MRMPTLRTERLLLRPLAFEDLDDLSGILGDPEAMVHYPRPFSRDDTRRWIEWNVRSYERHGFGLFALELLSNGRLVGDCGPTIQDVEGSPEVELGWHVSRDQWNRGLATEAGRAARDWAFSDLGRDRLISLVRPENVASCRVAEKLGMRIEREIDRKGLRHYVYARSRPRSSADAPPDAGPDDRSA